MIFPMIELLKKIPALMEWLVPLMVFLTGAGFLRMLSWLKQFRKQVVAEATTATMDAMISQGMLAAIANLDPKGYFTLDLEYEAGGKDHLPVLRDRFLRISQNTVALVLDSSAKGTILSMVCQGHGRVESHRHAGSEELTVIQGTVTCLKTGEVYRAGDRRLTEPGVYHGAALHDATCILVHLPPLPTAAERPVSLRNQTILA